MQKALAATLQYMADQETAARSRGREAGLAAARDAFYRGDIARAIVKYPEGEWRHPVGRGSRELSFGLRRAGRRPRSATSSSMPAARGARGPRCCRR